MEFMEDGLSGLIIDTPIKKEMLYPDIMGHKAAFHKRVTLLFRTQVSVKVTTKKYLASFIQNSNLFLGKGFISTQAMRSMKSLLTSPSKLS